MIVANKSGIKMDDWNSDSLYGLVFFKTALLTLVFMAAANARQISANSDVQACRLVEKSARHDTGLGFPKNMERLKSTGNVNIGVLFVDFMDARAISSPASVLSIISPRAENFFSTVSYGQLKLTLKPVNYWVHLTRKSDDYNMRRGATLETHRKYIQEAINQGGENISYSGLDGLLIIANPLATGIEYGPSFAAPLAESVRTNSGNFNNAVTSGRDLINFGWTWLNHELGHSMSLVDLGTENNTNHKWHTHVGDFSIMGNPTGLGREYFAWERWHLNWLENDQVACIKDMSATVHLTPVERRGGIKMAVIPLSQSSAVVIESRRREGYDALLPKAGPLVYVVDTTRSAEEGTIKIYPIDESDTHHLNAPLSIKDSILVQKVRITYVGGGADEDIIEIKVND